MKNHYRGATLELLIKGAAQPKTQTKRELRIKPKSAPQEPKSVILRP